MQKKLPPTPPPSSAQPVSTSSSVATTASQTSSTESSSSQFEKFQVERRSLLIFALKTYALSSSSNPGSSFVPIFESNFNIDSLTNEELDSADVTAILNSIAKRETISKKIHFFSHQNVASSSLNSTQGLSQNPPVKTNVTATPPPPPIIPAAKTTPPAKTTSTMPPPPPPPTLSVSKSTTQPPPPPPLSSSSSHISSSVSAATASSQSLEFKIEPAYFASLYSQIVCMNPAQQLGSRFSMDCFLDDIIGNSNRSDGWHLTRSEIRLASYECFLLASGLLTQLNPTHLETALMLIRPQLDISSSQHASMVKNLLLKEDAMEGHVSGATALQRFKDEIRDKKKTFATKFPQQASQQAQLKSVEEQFRKHQALHYRWKLFKSKSMLKAVDDQNPSAPCSEAQFKDFVARQAKVFCHGLISFTRIKNFLLFSGGSSSSIKTDSEIVAERQYEDHLKQSFAHVVDNFDSRASLVGQLKSLVTDTFNVLRREFEEESSSLLHVDSSKNFLYSAAFPLNVELYIPLLESCFHFEDDANEYEESMPEIFDALQCVRTMLGISEKMHRLCLIQCIFRLLERAEDYVYANYLCEMLGKKIREYCNVLQAGNKSFADGNNFSAIIESAHEQRTASEILKQLGSRLAQYKQSYNSDVQEFEAHLGVYVAALGLMQASIDNHKSKAALYSPTKQKQTPSTSGGDAFQKIYPNASSTMPPYQDLSSIVQFNVGKIVQLGMFNLYRSTTPKIVEKFGFKAVKSLASLLAETDPNNKKPEPREFGFDDYLRTSNYHQDLDLSILSELGKTLSEELDFEFEHFSPVIAKHCKEARMFAVSTIFCCFVDAISFCIDKLQRKTFSPSILDALKSCKDLFNRVAPFCANETSRIYPAVTESLTQVSKKCIPLIGEWFNTTQVQYSEMLARALKIEKWEPVSEHVKYSTSVFDIFSMLYQNVPHLFEIACIPGIIDYIRAMAQCTSGVIQQYAMQVSQNFSDPSALIPPVPEAVYASKSKLIKLADAVLINNNNAGGGGNAAGSKGIKIRAINSDGASFTEVLTRMSSLIEAKHQFKKLMADMAEQYEALWKFAAAPKMEVGFGEKEEEEEDEESDEDEDTKQTPKRRYQDSDDDDQEEEEQQKKQVETPKSPPTPTSPSEHALAKFLFGSKRISFDTFEQSTSTHLNGLIRELACYFGTRNIYVELKKPLLDELYIPTVKSARIASALDNWMDPMLKDICDLAHETVIDLILSETIKAFAKAFETIIFNGGPSRIFSESDTKMILEDLGFVERFFFADGNGLSQKEIVKHTGYLHTVIGNLMDVSSADLINGGNVCVSYNEMPVKVDYATQKGVSPFCQYLVYRVLLHRPVDPVAKKFLKAKRIGPK